ncbi:MAG TPA: DNA adenine methylase, partial [Solirubrobacterales bacterium]|nr:DNA adenine methylase [Solirubrobacterales bacterium]
RRVICNDVQGFAALVARCLIATPDSPPPVSLLREVLTPPYSYNRRLLVDRFRAHLAEEDRIIADVDATRYRDTYRRWRHVGNDPDLRDELATAHETTPYRLATLNFAWGYFGLRQAIAIDSIRYAIDRAREDQRLSASDADWALVALLQAASCASASPGHFAQYLKPDSDRGFTRIAQQRKRNIWTQFVFELNNLKPYGNRAWRSSNDVVQADALSMWGLLDSLSVERAIVYADPPYSKDHYSRYYHVLETLALYDYPTAKGTGRYRPDRFITPFSLKTRVRDAMEEFCAAIRDRGFTLILSYPSNGLLNAECGIDLTAFLRDQFTQVELRMDRPTSHSTLGARHGNARNAVNELLWVAK